MHGRLRMHGAQRWVLILFSFGSSFCVIWHTLKCQETQQLRIKVATRVSVDRLCSCFLSRSWCPPLVSYRWSLSEIIRFYDDWKFELLSLLLVLGDFRWVIVSKLNNWIVLIQYNFHASSTDTPEDITTIANQSCNQANACSHTSGKNFTSVHFICLSTSLTNSWN